MDRTLPQTDEELQNLISDWLTLARVEGGALVKERVEVDLKPILSGILASYEEMAAAEQVSLETVWPEEPMCVCGDRNCLNVLFDNLITNAIKYNKPGGKATVSGCLSGGEVVIAVADTGVGIPEQYRPFLFDEFFRIKVKASKGRRAPVWDCIFPGRSFRKWRRYRGREPGRNRLDFSGALAGMARTGGKHDNGELRMTMEEKRILIVDDDRDFAEAVACFLEANRFTVFKAHDGKEGVKLAKLERPDLILMDIMMNERTEGFFTIQEMRRDAELKNVPIFVISSFCTHLPDFEIPQSGGWMAHDMFFSKPVDLNQLLEQIRQRLGKAA